MSLVKAMMIIRQSDVTGETLRSSCGMPLILCSIPPRIQRMLDDANYQTISINTPLSKALLQYPTEERSARLEKELQIILNADGPLLLIDFEMLFDPRHKIDVLKLFCERARIIDLAILWPGYCSSKKLCYAAPEDPDYHEYDCDKYQIRIVR